jgi:hypothetical protein
MILFSRSAARDFRAVLTRCVSGRPRGPSPAVVVRVRGGGRVVWSSTEAGVVLTHTTPAAGIGDDLVVLPGGVLADVEGAGDEPVTLERQSKVRGTLRWADGGASKTLPVELILPGRQHELPDPPAEFAPVTPCFLAALYECGRTAAKENGRYALSRLQLQGRHGRVVATDGKVALLWDGFPLPFADDVLVPAVPAFGAKPLLRHADVTVGRTPAHVVVRAGPWAVWLPADAKARYPDVASAVPRDAPTSAAIDPRDAAEVLKLLPGLPGGGHDLRPVTVDADGVLKICAADGGDLEALTLTRSLTTGPPARVVIDRRVLARGLALGCRALKLTPERPVVFEGDGLTLVAVQLDAALAVSPTASRTQPTP